jgi:hypothetical protein
MEAGLNWERLGYEQEFKESLAPNENIDWKQVAEHWQRVAEKAIEQLKEKKMKYKWVIMQELEDTNCANPYLIVNSEERAEELCFELESQNPGFIFWTYMCEEE